ncbi:MAG TPA: hypothetical protein DCR40_21945 [Prolixibacteraceae bacterium]|nr:hypothetical protein [Prolixibacteraceae bacterium]
MKTSKTNVEADNSGNSQKGKMLNKLVALFIFFLLVLSTSVSFAHCDTMEGPLVLDAKKAISQNNVNIVLKWVQAANETEIKDAFNQMMKVRVISADAKDLAEKYFFDTLVRIHRAGEGVTFTGVKPAGTPIDEKIKAADKSIEAGNLSPLKGKVSKNDLPELTERFEKVISLKNFDVNNVKAGREYIEAYVQFFKFAEGEAEGHAAESHGCGH